MLLASIIFYPSIIFSKWLLGSIELSRRYNSKKRELALASRPIRIASETTLRGGLTRVHRSGEDHSVRASSTNK